MNKSQWVLASCLVLACGESKSVPTEGGARAGDPELTHSFTMAPGKSALASVELGSDPPALADALMVDAKLPDGSRLHAVIPPLALRGPTLSIRRFKNRIVQFEDMVRVGTLAPEMADFLIAADGQVLACKYGVHADDQWSVDELLRLVRAAGKSCGDRSDPPRRGCVPESARRSSRPRPVFPRSSAGARRSPV